MIHRQHHHYQKWVKIGICKTAPNLIIISLYQYHCFHHLIRWEYCYHPFTEIVWVSAVAPESYFTDRIFHLKIRSLSHSCQPYPHIFPTLILSPYHPHAHLILGALTNESFLLQVSFVLNKKSHQPNCPGADLKIHRFWNLSTVKVCQSSNGKKDDVFRQFQKMMTAPKRLYCSLMKLLPQGVSMATWGNFDSAASEGWPVFPCCREPGHQFIEFSSSNLIALLHTREFLHLHKDFLLHFYLKLPGALVGHSFLCPPELFNYVLKWMLGGKLSYWQR